MDTTTVDTLLFEINGKVEAISAKIDSLNDMILKHESRITMLEREVMQTSGSHRSFKDTLLQMLVKCVLVALTAIASLAGAGTLLQSMVK